MFRQGYGGRPDLIMDLSLDVEGVMQIEIMDTIGMVSAKIQFIEPMHICIYGPYYLDKNYG